MNKPFSFPVLMSFMLALALAAACTTSKDAAGQTARNASLKTTLNVETESYSRVHVSGRLTACFHLTQGKTYCRITGQSPYVKNVSARTRKGTLYVESATPFALKSDASRDLRVDIYGPEPAALAVSSMAVLAVEEPLGVNSALTLSATTGGTLKGAFTARSLAVSAESTGKVELAHAAANWIKLSATGMGTVLAETLNAQTADLQASTGGNVRATSVKALQTAFFAAKLNGKVTAGGTGNDTYIKCSGNGKIDLSKYTCLQTEAEATTGGKVTLVRPNTYKGSTATGGKIEKKTR